MIPWSYTKCEYEAVNSDMTLLAIENIYEVWRTTLISDLLNQPHPIKKILSDQAFDIVRLIPEILKPNYLQSTSRRHVCHTASRPAREWATLSRLKQTTIQEIHQPANAPLTARASRVFIVHDRGSQYPSLPRELPDQDAIESD